MFSMRLFLVFAAALAAWASPASAAGIAFPPGSRIGLAPPADAGLSTHFPGFEDAARKVTITILDLPGAAFPSLQSAVFGNQLKGLEDAKRESFPFESGIGFLLSGHVKVNGVTADKWLLLATTSAGQVPDLTTLITVTVPETAHAIYTDAVVRKALASVTFRPAPVEEQLRLLPFKLADRSGFRVLKVLSDGIVILTDGPTDNLLAQPYMIVSVGRGAPSDPKDRGRFARDLLERSPLRELHVQSGDAMRVAGAPGFELRATAKASDGKPLSVVQWLRFGPIGLLQVIGVTHSDRWDALFPRFRAVRDGIDVK
jgi:hypothetical protein